jgi:putative ABC transport system permease protein
MWFIEGVAIAFKSIAANKLRSILTLIGIIIGVTTVIAVVSIINVYNRQRGNYHLRGRLVECQEK